MSCVYPWQHADGCNCAEGAMRYRIVEDGALSHVEAVEGAAEWDTFASFGEAKAALLAHLKGRRDDFRDAISRITRTKKADALAYLPTNSGQTSNAG